MASLLKSIMVGLISVSSEITISSSKFSYKISDELDLNEYSRGKLIYLCDNKVLEATKKLLPLDNNFIPIEISEATKSLAGVEEVLLGLAKFGANREDCLVVVGGGALQDIATMAASIYMRGIDWIYLPTTLMSMIDSCIGGKSSLNLGGFKNLLGNYYPPKKIIINTNFIDTLTNTDVASGISEGIKICFATGIEDTITFQKLINNWQSSSDKAFLKDAIFLSLRKKKFFVEIDEFDKQERRLLNFGHSFGHALEAATEYKIPHGIAIFVGMQAAIFRSNNNEPCEFLSTWIKSQVNEFIFDFPAFTIEKDKFLQSLARDKKNTGKHQILILPNTEGRLEEISFDLSDSNLELCAQSLITALDMLGFRYEVF